MFPQVKVLLCQSYFVSEYLRVLVLTIYSTFDIFLLNDKTGSRVDAIEDAYSGKPEKITLKILQEWLEGKGLPLTWESLVQTLRDTGLSTRPWRIMLKLPPIFLFFYAHISCLFCFSLCLFFFQTCLFFSM